MPYKFSPSSGLLKLGLHSPLIAFVDIVLLWIAIVFTIYYAYKSSRKAAYLLLPYLLWVSFAAVLNGWIWLGN